LHRSLVYFFLHSVYHLGPRPCFQPILTREVFSFPIHCALSGTLPVDAPSCLFSVCEIPRSVRSFNPELSFPPLFMPPVPEPLPTPGDFLFHVVTCGRAPAWCPVEGPSPFCSCPATRCPVFLPTRVLPFLFRTFLFIRAFRLFCFAAGFFSTGACECRRVPGQFSVVSFLLLGPLGLGFLSAFERFPAPL